MVVKSEIMEELYKDAGPDRIERAREYVRTKNGEIGIFKGYKHRGSFNDRNG